jgi:hypothetical protein
MSRKSTAFRAIISAAFMACLFVRCAGDGQESYSIHRNPVLPSIDPYAAVEGVGTSGVSNPADPQLLLGMSRSYVASILGAPVDSSVGLMIYQNNGITFTIKYVSGAAVKIEVDCDRWVSVNGKGDFLVAYNNTESEMTAKYGRCDRDENVTWWYDAHGIGFIYDYFSNPVRVKKVVVYAPVIYLDSAYIGYPVDNDADGFLSSFRIYFKIGMPAATQDSVSFKFYQRTNGTASWGSPFLSTSNYYIDTANALWFLSRTGTDSLTVDFLLEIYSRSSVLLDTAILSKIHVEPDSLD